jgi:hypothetical protein
MQSFGVAAAMGELIATGRFQSIDLSPLRRDASKIPRAG